MLRAALIALLLLLLPATAQARRVALVVGNSAYKYAGELENPKNDAADMAAALKKLDFQVIDGIDLDKAAFDRRIRDFATALVGAEVAVLFYAGHGLQVGGQNYLVPTDAELTSAAALDFEMVRIDLIQRSMEREAQTNILFLDACRNNPLARNLARAMGTRSAQIGRGLASIESGVGTLISFSTQPGNVALDGTGRNSPFAGALVKHLSSSSDDLSAILISVRNDVMRDTQRQQVPWEHSALTGRFYFKPGAAQAAQPGQPPQPPATSEAERVWSLMKDSTSVAALEAFVTRYRGTFFAELAQLRIDELKRQQVAVATPVPPPPPAPKLVEPQPSPTGRSTQFIPQLVYRTGPYTTNGVPLANGTVDYYRLVNERDGGIDGVRIEYEECETGYATDRGVGCYEQLKGRAPYFMTPSTGMAFAFTEKASLDKVPIITAGAGRSESRDGSVFPWTFPLLGTHWTAADIILQHIAKQAGGFDKLKGKKIALVYHDSPYGKEPIALLQKRAGIHGFEALLVPVTHPGVDQKSQWLSIRQNRPDYVMLWGWGIMNTVAIKEAAAVAFPRGKMFGVWWSGAEPDVKPAGEAANGYNAVTIQRVAGRFKVHEDLKKHLYDRGRGQTKWENTGEVLYVRGLIEAMLGVEAIRTAQGRFGKQPLTGEQVRWGFENLDLTEAKLARLGFGGVLMPIKLSCADHEGSRAGAIQTWDGEAWKVVSGPYFADDSVLAPMARSTAATYATARSLALKCL